MPLAAMTQAAARANSREWLRQSWQMATPLAGASGLSARITWAKAWVAWRITWTFIRFSPVPMMPRRPAVPKESRSKKRLSISFSSPAMAVNSARSASDSWGAASQRR